MKTFAIVVGVVLLCSVGGFAMDFTDSRAVFVIDIGDARTSGYRLPFVGVGAGLDVQAPRMLFQVSALYSRTDKYAHRDVAQFYGKSRLLANFGKFAAGGGTTFARLTFGETGESRYSMRPFVSIGYLNRRAMILVEYGFSGLDNAYTVRDISLATELCIAQHVRIVHVITHRSLANGWIQASGLETDLYLKFF